MVLYFTDWEAVLHVEILHGAAGSVVAVLQHLFPVALVGVAAALPPFFGDYMAESC